MFISQRTIAFAVFVLLGSFTSALNFSSPCPDLFHYDSTDQPNQWNGTLTILSDVELHGVWLRLKFSEKSTQLDVNDDFGLVIRSEDGKEYLIKNRDLLLKAETPTYVKLTVKYEGDKIPTLTGYRLNARTVCSSDDIKFRQLFLGDLNNKDFLTSITSQPTPTDKEFEGCGTTPLLANHEPGNKKTQNGQWPWQGAIYIQNNNGEKYVCGAILVSSKHVLTSAHCVTYQTSELPVSVRQLAIYLGQNSDNQKDGENVQKFEVKTISLHPGYRAKQLLNDLAIIQLDKSVVINDYVRPICLGQDATTVEGFLIGYGISKDKIDDLNQAQAIVLGEKECLEKNPDLGGLLTDNVICATYLKFDSSCVGNSGSSLVSESGGGKPFWELKGIVSVGSALQDKYTCNPDSRVFLVNVTNYLKWIRSIVF